MNATPVNRRRHERIAVAAMYTHVSVRVGEALPLLGHSYDISEGGVQVEMDEAIPAGTQVSVEMVLPLTEPARFVGTTFEDRTVRAIGNVVWVDVSEPGPVRMAVAFTRFETEADRGRLLSQISTRQILRAA